MSFHNETHVKRTRRTRRCDWCWQLIEKDEPSVATSGIFEGDFYSGRYHPECNLAASRYYRTFQCWGEEMPEEQMERGGIRTAENAEAGLPEVQCHHCGGDAADPVWNGWMRLCQACGSKFACTRSPSMHKQSAGESPERSPIFKLNP